MTEKHHILPVTVPGSTNMAATTTIAASAAATTVGGTTTTSTTTAAAAAAAPPQPSSSSSFASTTVTTPRERRIFLILLSAALIVALPVVIMATSVKRRNRKDAANSSSSSSSSSTSASSSSSYRITDITCKVYQRVAQMSSKNDGWIGASSFAEQWTCQDIDANKGKKDQEEDTSSSSSSSSGGGGGAGIQVPTDLTSHPMYVLVGLPSRIETLHREDLQRGGILEMELINVNVTEEEALLIIQDDTEINVLIREETIKGSAGDTDIGDDDPDDDDDDDGRRGLRRLTDASRVSAFEQYAPVRTRSILVVRVSDDTHPPVGSSEEGLFDDWFGGMGGVGGGGDDEDEDDDEKDHVNLRSLYDQCSFGKMEFVPSAANLMPSEKGIQGGKVVSVQIDDVTAPNAERRALEAIQSQRLLSSSSSSSDKSTMPDHVVLCMPEGTAMTTTMTTTTAAATTTTSTRTMTRTRIGVNDDNDDDDDKDHDEIWGSYAYANHWLSVYHGDWCTYASVQARTLGVNMNVGPSLEKGKYGDQSGLMGFSYLFDDVPQMCFNGAKNAFWGWYHDKSTVVTIDGNAGGNAYYVGNLAAFAEYDRVVAMGGEDDGDGDGRGAPAVVNIRLGEEYYLQYNLAVGVNKQTQSRINEVSITRAKSMSDPSYGIGGLSPSYPVLQIPNYDGRGTDVTLEWCHSGPHASASIHFVTVAIYRTGYEDEEGGGGGGTGVVGGGGRGSVCSRGCMEDSPTYQFGGHFGCAELSRHVDETELAAFCQLTDFALNCCATCATVANVTPPVRRPIDEDGNPTLSCPSDEDVQDFALGGKTCQDLAGGDDDDGQTFVSYCASSSRVREHCCASCREALGPAPSILCGGNNDTFKYDDTYTCSELEATMTDDQLSTLCSERPDVRDECCGTCFSSTSAATTERPKKGEEQRPPSPPPLSSCTKDGNNATYRFNDKYSCLDLETHFDESDLAGLCLDDPIVAGQCCRTCDAVNHIDPPHKTPFRPDAGSCDEDNATFAFGGESCQILSSSLMAEDMVSLCSHVTDVHRECCRSCLDAGTTHVFVPKDDGGGEEEESSCKDNSTFAVGSDHYTCEFMGIHVNNYDLASICTEPDMRANCCATCASVGHITPPDKTPFESPESGTCAEDDPFYRFGGQSCQNLTSSLLPEDMAVVCSHVSHVNEFCCRSCLDVNTTHVAAKCADNPTFTIGSNGYTCSFVRAHTQPDDLASFCFDADFASNCCDACASVEHVAPPEQAPFEPPEESEACSDDAHFMLGGESCRNLTTSLLAEDMATLCSHVSDVSKNCCRSCHDAGTTTTRVVTDDGDDDDQCIDNTTFVVGNNVDGCAYTRRHVPDYSLASFCTDEDFRSNCCKSCSSVEHIVPPDKSTFEPDPENCADQPSFRFGGQSCQNLTSNLVREDMADICSHVPLVNEHCCRSCVDAGTTHVIVNGVDDSNDNSSNTCVDNSTFSIGGGGGGGGENRHTCSYTKSHVKEEELASLCADAEFQSNCCATCSSVSHVDPPKQTPFVPDLGGGGCADNANFAYGGESCQDLRSALLSEDMATLCTHVSDLTDQCCRSCHDAGTTHRVVPHRCVDNRTFTTGAGSYTCSSIRTLVTDVDLASFCDDPEFESNCCATCSSVRHVEPPTKVPFVPDPDACENNPNYMFGGASCRNLTSTFLKDDLATLCSQVSGLSDNCCRSCHDAGTTRVIVVGGDDENDGGGGQCVNNRTFTVGANHYTCSYIQDHVKVEDLASFCTSAEYASNCCEACSSVRHVAPPDLTSFDPDAETCANNEDFAFAGDSCQKMTSLLEDDELATLCSHVSDVTANCCRSCLDAGTMTAHHHHHVVGSTTAEDDDDSCVDNTTYTIGANDYTCSYTKTHVQDVDLASFCTHAEFRANCCATCSSVSDVAPPERPDRAPLSLPDLDSCHDDVDFMIGGDSCHNLTSALEPEDMSLMCTHISSVSEHCCRSCHDAGTSTKHGTAVGGGSGGDDDGDL